MSKIDMNDIPTNIDTKEWVATMKSKLGVQECSVSFTAFMEEAIATMEKNEAEDKDGE